MQRRWVSQPPRNMRASLAQHDRSTSVRVHAVLDDRPPVSELAEQLLHAVLPPAAPRLAYVLGGHPVQNGHATHAPHAPRSLRRRGLQSCETDSARTRAVIGGAERDRSSGAGYPNDSRRAVKSARVKVSEG